MSQADWNGLSDNLATTVVDHGITSGVDKPSGGGEHVYGFNALAATEGVVGLYATQLNFNPTTKGGSVRGAIRRGPSPSGSGFSPFMFMALQGTASTNLAYMLGLSNEDPFRIVLRKGALTGGIPSGAPDPDGQNNILMRSGQSFALSDAPWLHLRLDMIVQGSGDVLLQVFQNDLALNPVSTPDWQVVPGMEGPQSPSIEGFVDDSLGINTGSLPLTAGRIGFGQKSAITSARSFFDHMQVLRQL